MRYKITFEVDTAGREKNARITETIEHYKIKLVHYTIISSVEALDEALRVAKKRTKESGYLQTNQRYHKEWEVVKVDEVK